MAHLYERVGKKEGIKSMISDFFKKVENEEKLQRYYRGHQMEWITHKYMEYFCHLMEGPVEYTGQDLDQTHHRYNITHEDFEVFRNLLEQTMKEHSWDQEACDHVIQHIDSQKTNILRE